MPYATLPIVARDGLGLDASGLGWLFAIGAWAPWAALFRSPSVTPCQDAGLARLRDRDRPRHDGARALARTRRGRRILVGIGFFATSGVALSNTLLQELVDDAMRGRAEHVRPRLHGLVSSPTS